MVVKLFAQAHPSFLTLLQKGFHLRPQLAIHHGGAHAALNDTRVQEEFMDEEIRMSYVAWPWMTTFTANSV